MKIDVRPLLKGEKNVVSFDFLLPIKYDAEDYRVDDAVSIAGYVSDNGGYMKLSAECNLNYHVPCARCLRDLSGEISLRIERSVALNLEKEDEDDEYLIISNGEIDIDELVTEEIILSLPLRTVCSDDCKGLCPKCGCDLNKQKCGCVIKEHDPRWEALKIFTENKD